MLEYIVNSLRGIGVRTKKTKQNKSGLKAQYLANRYVRFCVQLRDGKFYSLCNVNKMFICN